MYGSITMTATEWATVKLWLQLRYNVAYENVQTYQRDSLLTTVLNLSRYDKAINDKQCFCIGVEATRLMFEAFGLKNYKRQNYSITVKG